MAVTACMMMSMLKARRRGTTNNRRPRAYQLWRCFIEGTLRPGTQQVRFRVRITERTYNLSLPPYKFPKAKFFPQQEIDDDGPPPRQVCTPKEPCQRHKVNGRSSLCSRGAVTPAVLLRNVQFETFKLNINKLIELGPL